MEALDIGMDQANKETSLNKVKYKEKKFYPSQYLSDHFELSSRKETIIWQDRGSSYKKKST